jgi:hypothetical protein
MYCEHSNRRTLAGLLQRALFDIPAGNQVVVAAARHRKLVLCTRKKELGHKKQELGHSEMLNDVEQM